MVREPFIIRKVISKASYMLNLPRAFAFPREVWIEPTTRCNIRCITCEKYLKPPGLDSHMKPEIYEKIKRSVLPRVYRANLIGLGEPLFAPLFNQMVDDCISLRVKFGFTTNGVLLREDIVEKTARYGWGLTLSIDGSTAETFESIRKGMSFSTILDRIAMIKSVLDIYKPEGFEYVWNFVAMKRNIHELPELVELARKHRVFGFTVFNFGVSGRQDDLSRESLAHQPEIAYPYFEQARAIADKYGIALLLPEYSPVAVESESTHTDSIQRSAPPSNNHDFLALPDGQRFPVPPAHRCYSPWYHSYFRYNGDVWPCCMYSTYSLGNIGEKKFSEIWNGDLYRRLRKYIHSGNPPYWCAWCNLSWGITGGDESYFYKHRPF